MTMGLMGIAACAPAAIEGEAVDGARADNVDRDTEVAKDFNAWRYGKKPLAEALTGKTWRCTSRTATNFARLNREIDIEFRDAEDTITSVSQGYVHSYSKKTFVAETMMEFMGHPTTQQRFSAPASFEITASDASASPKEIYIVRYFEHAAAAKALHDQSNGLQQLPAEFIRTAVAKPFTGTDNHTHYLVETIRCHLPSGGAAKNPKPQ
jgi:hypothetical protein